MMLITNHPPPGKPNLLKNRHIFDVKRQRHLSSTVITIKIISPPSRISIEAKHIHKQIKYNSCTTNETGSKDPR